MKDNQNKKTYKTIDLFAGIGGIRLAFESIGFETVFSNDFDKYCKQTYDANFDKVKMTLKDIRKIEAEELPEYDFLLGGFPCQAFSIAGYRKGFRDKRGNLFFEIARLLDETQPMGFLLENVKNLEGHDNGRTFKIISKTLRSLGYYMKHKILNTAEYSNIPQNRERIFIVGFKSRKHINNFTFPAPVSKEKRKKVVDLLEDEVKEKYYYNGKPLYKKLVDDVTQYGKVYQWRRKYVRENKNGVCPTLTANMGTGGHNVPIIKVKKGIRKITPRECARLQGFPDSFILPKKVSMTQKYKQLGNSVTVPVVKAVAEQMKKALNGNSSRLSQMFLV